MTTRRLEGLSVVLPALNEQGNVGRAVEAVRAAGRRLADQVEVIVVDDGSTDGTVAEARQTGARVVSHESNRGYGAALRSGFAAARHPWIFQMDCDNQFDPEELPKLVSLADEAQLVIGIRAARADQWRRIWAGWAWNQLCRLAFGFIVHDVDCGFKLLNRAAVGALDLGCNGAGISLELCVAARSAGFRIAEVEVHHSPRTTGAPTGLRWRVVVRGLYELYRLRLRYARRASRLPVPTTSMKAQAHQ
ncbi:MAG: glycosyltransferase family 2 protein [Vicinamibacterales bacterium]